MIRSLRERLRQGYRTTSYPGGPAPELPARFRGLPVIESSACDGCPAPCVESCPTGAVSGEASGPAIDLGACIFCGDCAAACPKDVIRFSRDHRLGATDRASLVRRAGDEAPPAIHSPAGRLASKRSLAIRVVSAGGCGACEADLNVLATPLWDLGRFGVHVVASPRHADALMLTGPVTRNMLSALLATYEAMPGPKVVIAVGACAISGGLFAGGAECFSGGGSSLSIDLYIPGCPPHPLVSLDALLRFLGRI